MPRFLTRFKKRPVNTIEEKTVGAKPVGYSESKLYSSDFPKYNPDDLIGRKGHKIYRNMLQDEQVKAVVKFKRDAITARDFTFRMPHDDEADPSEESKKRIKIYETMVRETHGSFADGMNFVMMAMYQGFSMTEKLIDTFDYEGKPYIGIKKLVPKPFETFKFNVDEYGQIVKTIQALNAKEQTIDLNRFVYYVQNPEVDYHYGQSELFAAYRSWYSKDIIIRLYNIFLEKFAGGFVVGKPTAGTSLTAGTPDYNAMLAAMDSIQNQSSILLPHNIDLDVQRPSTTDQYEKAIQLHDLQISKSLLVPNLLGITPQASSGGFAQANTQLEAFLWTLDADAMRLEEALNEQIFIPLNKLNFADGLGPVLRFKPVSETKKFEIAKVWKELVVGAAVEASDSDEHHLREMLDFPEKGEPLDLAPEVGLPGEVAPGTKQREPVAKTNTKGKVVKSRNFARAEKRVAFNVIERKATMIEDAAVVAIESKLVDMVSNLVERIEHEKLGTPYAGINGISAIDFIPRQKSKVRKEIDNMMKQSWNLGKQHASTELDKAKKEQFKINMGRIDVDASDFLAANGFRMFGLLSDDMRAIIQGILVNGIKFSWTTKQIVDKVYDEFTAEGFILASSNSLKTGRTLDMVLDAIGDSAGEAYRIKTAVRTNVFEAINEARWSVFTDPALGDFVEALEYSAILDSRTTRVCRHLDDRVYPADHPVWNKYRPPNHFNCRSILIPVTLIDEDVEGKDSDDGRWSKPPTVEPARGFGS